MECAVGTVGERPMMWQQRRRVGGFGDRVVTPNTFCVTTRPRPARSGVREAVGRPTNRPALLNASGASSGAVGGFAPWWWVATPWGSPAASAVGGGVGFGGEGEVVLLFLDEVQPQQRVQSVQARQ